MFSWLLWGEEETPLKKEIRHKTRELRKSQDVLVAASGHANNSLVLHVEIKGFFSLHPEDYRQVKGHSCTTIIQLVDMPRFQLYQLASVWNPVSGA